MLEVASSTRTATARRDRPTRDGIACSSTSGVLTVGACAGSDTNIALVPPQGKQTIGGPRIDARLRAGRRARHEGDRRPGRRAHRHVVRRRLPEIRNYVAVPAHVELPRYPARAAVPAAGAHALRRPLALAAIGAPAADDLHRPRRPRRAGLAVLLRGPRGRRAAQPPRFGGCGANGSTGCSGPSVDLGDVTGNLARFVEDELTNPQLTGVNWAQHVALWLARPGRAVVRYEQLRTDVAETLAPAFEQLTGQPADRDYLRLAARAFRLRAAAARGPPNAPTRRCCARGAVGDWRTYFTAEASEIFARHAGSSTRAELGSPGDGSERPRATAEAR